jgi:hypothetical protein
LGPVFWNSMLFLTDNFFGPDAKTSLTIGTKIRLASSKIQLLCIQIYWCRNTNFLNSNKFRKIIGSE